MDSSKGPIRPDLRMTGATVVRSDPAGGHPQRRRKNHRGGKKKKSRRKSFAALPGDVARDDLNSGLDEPSEDFYSRPGRRLSNTSIESEALLDHRHREQQPFLRPRRPSVMTGSTSFQPQFTTPQTASRLKSVIARDSGDEDDHDDGMATPWDERAPLLSNSGIHKAETFAGYGANDAHRKSGAISRRDSSRGSSRKRPGPPLGSAGIDFYNVNYPPSVPGTPTLRPSGGMEMSFGDIMLRDELEDNSPRRTGDESDSRGGQGFQPSLERRHTVALDAETDVCFPQEGLSDVADDDVGNRDPATYRGRGRRRRGKWPDLAILDEWSTYEKEGRSDERRAKKITEPQLINGRLRPVHKGWFQSEEDAPYRFTYFNEDFQSTIHSQTISELVQPGGTFRELFVPDPPLLSDSSDDEEEEEDYPSGLHQVLGGHSGDPLLPARQASVATTNHSQFDHHRDSNGEAALSATPKQGWGDRTPRLDKSPEPSHSPKAKEPKPPKYGDRPVWWLDVLSPTEAEMKILSKAFGIHPLTAEDVMVQEAREKVELFRHYYFVNYRTFDQDQTSENYLEPVNMYVIVFREGVLSFHFSPTPHSANVRRRIRQLRDYMMLSSDWISYAIIDDITDVFGPLIQNIEDEVDDIDDAILMLHSSGDPSEKDGRRRDGERSDAGETTSADAGRDMLRRVGDCRKRVMSLYRLLGNKADVIKGFAKRCNEHWDVAPRSEIGLYLGDIQDHIVTMTSNLSHYEKILARSHANYLAQINIRMNERSEQTADVLGKLTVLGTIVLPMNIITGLWGMNVWVPGQAYEGDLKWFAVITAGLLLFGLACYLIAKRVYKIV